MARKQTVINYHGSDVSKLVASALTKGEIAILHGAAASATSIYTLDGANKLTEFVSKDTIQDMIDKGPVSKVEALSSATINLSSATVYISGQVQTLIDEKHLKKINVSSASGDYIKPEVTAKDENQEQTISIGTTYGTFTFTPATGTAISSVTATNGLAKAQDVASLGKRLIDNDTIIDGKVEAVDERVDTVSGSVKNIESWAASGISADDVAKMRVEYGAKAMVSAFSATVVAQYATSADTHAAIKAVDTNLGKLSGATEAISGYAASQIKTLDGYVANIQKWAASGISADDVAKMRVEYGAKAMVSAFSATVVAQYATSADTHAAIKAVDTNLGKLSGATESKIGTLSGVVATNETKLAGISAESGVTGYVADKISKAIVNVYKFMGSCTYAQLIAKTGQVKGNVWNVTDECTHEGKKYPAGTNFAYVNETSGQTGASNWDALGGTVDLSIYATSADTVAAINVVDTKVETLSSATESKFDTLEGKVEAIESWAASGISADDVAKMRAEYGAKAMVSAFSGTVVAQYATSANTVAAIDAVDDKVDTLSGATKSISGYAAYQISTLDGYVSNIKEKYVTGATVSNLSGLTAATFSNNVLDFDFGNVVIDCGTF